MNFRTVLCPLFLVATFICFANEASAQVWKNTPFDPGTWNPRDWVESPPPPRPPQPETLRVRNLGTEVIHFCYGDGRNLWGWAEVKPGQTVSRRLYLGSKHIAYVLIEKGGREVRLKNRSSTYAPYHAKKRFKISYRGNDEWDVDIPGVVRGRFHRASFAKLGLSGGKFYKLPVKRDGTHNVSIR